MSSIFKAEFIRQNEDLGTVCPVFRKIFWADKKIRKATLSVSALGFYEVHINNNRIGKFIFAPGWTSYRTRLQYQNYNVTKYLEECNTIDIAVGVGRRRHKRPDEELPFLKSDEIAVIAALTVEYEDDTVEVITTDKSWECMKSNVLFSDIYDGEKVDFTVECEDKFTVKEVPLDKKILIETEGEETREMARLDAVELITTPTGEKVIDFKQEVTGYVEWVVPARKGNTFKIQHAEFLDKDGNFYTENLRSAKCEIEVTSNGVEQVYKPHFSFQGFRFIKLIGFNDDEIKLENFTAVVVFSDMKRTGFFACGHEDVQQLYENIVWGQRGNFLDIPTDCPQRDERMGWTGDAQVFARTAIYNYDTRKFFRKWLHDLAADQEENGAVGNVVPAGWQGGGSAAWGDAAVIVPYQMYLAYNDTRIIEEQWESMTNWLKFIETECSEKGRWDKGGHFGDWLSLDAGYEAAGGFTDKNLIATAMYAYSTSLVIKMGKAVGKDVSYYEEMYPVIVEQYRKNYLNTGKEEHETQTANVLALYLNLTDNREREAEKLVKLIEECGHLKTGFVGTPYLLHVLQDIGRVDLAYKLLLKDTFPSWLYSVKMGATTMWERWDGMKEDRSFATPEMNSFNHYAFGAVGDWLFSTVAGIRPDENEPGYKHIIFEPIPNKELGYAKARILTPNGEIISSWEFKGDSNLCEFSFTIPDGSYATLYLDDEEYEFVSGTYTTEFEYNK